MILPSYYNPERSSAFFFVDYEGIRSTLLGKEINRRRKRNAIVLTACQNVFLKKSSDVRTVSEFIYRNIEEIDDIFIPLISHPYISVFSFLFWLDRSGRAVKKGTIITSAGLKRGDFQINPMIVNNLTVGKGDMFFSVVVEYLEALEKQGDKLIAKECLSVFGTLQFALISLIEEAVFSHASIYRKQPFISYAGPNPFSEFLSVFEPVIPEFLPADKIVFSNNLACMEKLSSYENIVFASLSREIGANSLSQFLDFSSYAGKVYSNHSFLTGGKSKKESNINSERLILSDLSILTL